MALSNTTWTIIIIAGFAIGFMVSKRYTTWIVWSMLLLHPFVLGFTLQDPLIPTITFIAFALGASVARLESKYDKLASKLIDTYLFYYKIGDYERVLSHLESSGANIRRFDDSDIAWDVEIENMLWRFYYHSTNIGLLLTSFNLIGTNANAYNNVGITAKKDSSGGTLTLFIRADNGKKELKLLEALEKECMKRNIKCM